VSGIAFAEAVAVRCGRDPRDVDAILARNGIIADPTPPAARTLRLASVRISGTKRLEGLDVPFEFAWEGLGDGLWGIASAENFVGKSSLIQIILWALRGSPKSLVPSVRSWLARVEVTFVIDSRDVDVSFDVLDGVPSGEVRIAGNATPQLFSSEESFKRIMQDAVMRPLGLEPIASSQKRAGSDDVIRYDDGWLAFTGAFLSDTRSDAIIGEDVGVNVTQKLLQVYLGLPWATTQFQARAARRVLESEATQRKRKLASLGGRTDAQMQAELDEVNRQLLDESARNASTAQLLAAEAVLENLQERGATARDRLRDLQGLLTETKDAKTRAERALLDIAEENHASAFFKQLEPGECPRCSTAISDVRKQRESSEHECSVCATIFAPPDSADIAAEKALAEREVRDAKRQQADAEAAVADAQLRLETILRERSAAGERVSSLARLGTAADVQVLQKRAQRLEGMLEVARAVLGTEDTEDQTLSVVSAAQDEADARVQEASNAVLARVSEEITRLVRIFGMRNVENVTLDRAAHVTVRRGGVGTSFTHLATGEQLRLRIATVLALVRIGKQFGAGRHPGLLFIDAPGTEEMTEQNFSDLLREVSQAAAEVGSVQIIVAMTGITEAKAAIPPERLLVVPAGSYLW
jgi:hypothetical protein